MIDAKPLFTAFFNAAPERLHFAAHSHHPWPDVTLKAQRQYWQDSVRMADDKWDLVFNGIIPDVQGYIASILNLPDGETLAFAPSTHEFIVRLLSCIPKKPRILTTDSEFHSFSRQIARLTEDDLVDVTHVPTKPFETFPARFMAAMDHSYDMVFFSHVYFNTGYAVPDINAIVAAVPNPETLVVIDGYQAFMAIPTDLSKIAGRAFYLACSYKYAMAGEGACFMHCPPGHAMRPVDTGWFAAFGALPGPKDEGVAYASGGGRFMGSSFDPSGLYRMRAVFEMLEQKDISVKAIHAHAIALQATFLRHNDKLPGQLITPVDSTVRGHFLAFETKHAETLYRRLHAQGIVTDYRHNVLRFGFGIYQDEADIARLHMKLTRAA